MVALTVLHIFSSGSFTRGAAFSMCSLAEELNRYDEVRVIAVCPPTKSHEVVRHLQAAGVETHEMHISRIAHHPLGTGALAATKLLALRMVRTLLTVRTDRRIAKLIRAEQVDIVHICDGVLDIGYRPAKIMGVPLIWHFREFLEEDLGDLYDAKAVAFRNFAKADAAIAISEAVRCHYAKRLPNLPFTTVFNGVTSASYFERNDAQVSPHRFDEPTRLLFLGGINTDKGIVDVLEAAALLKKMTTKTFEVDIFGNVRYESDRREYDQRIASLGLEDCVAHRGWAHMDIERIANYDIELVCSKAEAFGRVTAEAMCARTVVVGADSGGTTELLEDGRGVLYTQGDATSLANAILQVLEDPRERKRMEQRAYDYAQRHFTLEHYAAGVYEVYQRVLDDRSTRQTSSD